LGKDALPKSLGGNYDTSGWNGMIDEWIHKEGMGMKAEAIVNMTVSPE
jgi:hypothetical protein